MSGKISKDPLPVQRYLTAPSSIFLDAIRLTAALDVAFTHARAIWFRSKEWDLVPSHLAHGSVIVFFVLSGYVIAYTTSTTKRTAREYASARLGRLYSVFLPAFIFTIIISLILLCSNPDLLRQYSRDNTVVRYVISLFFCNEIWFLSSAPLINGVIWSLSYEFWFYAIFGLWLFKDRYRKLSLWLILVVCIAGPKILIMLSIWLLGVLAYKLHKPKITAVGRVALIILSLIISVTIMLGMKQLPYEMNTSKLYWASSFFSDFMAAIFIAFAFWLLPLTGNPVRQNSKVKKFRKIADLTFPLYVLHFPTLLMCRTLINIASPAGMWLAFAITLFFCFIAGIFIEKWHPRVTAFFKNLFGKPSLMRSAERWVKSIPVKN